LYFKNGKSVLIDYAWIDKETIYAVHTGKRFAIGYDKDEIDIAKSDINSTAPTTQKRSEAPTTSKYSKQEPVQARRANLPPPFDDLLPPKTTDRELFASMVDQRLGGNPYFRSINDEAESEFNRELPGLWNHVFSGKLSFRASLDPDQQAYWNDIVNRFRTDVWKRKELEIQRAKEMRDFLMYEFKMQTATTSRPPQPAKRESPTIRVYPASPP